MDKKMVPKVRFKGFSDDWELRKLGTLYKINRERNLIGITKDKTISISSMSFNTSGNNANISSIPNYKVLRIGDLAYEGHTNRSFSFGRFVLNDIGTGIMSPRFSSLRPIKNMNVNYWKHYIHYEPIMKYILVKSTKRGTMMNELVSNDLFKQQIHVPSDMEQNKIGQLLNLLDISINLQQRQLDLYTKLKKGLLQKLFPKDGEKVPEIRLADFTGNWEQHKLGELGKIQSGVGFPETEQGGTSGVPFFKISDMNKKGNEYEMISANNYVSKEQIIRKKWKPIKNVPAIIFAKVGAAIMLNRKRLVLSTFLIDNNIMAYAFDNSWSAGFGKALFDNIYLPKYAQIGALPSYNGMDIKNIEITIPGKQEQIQMNKLFSQLNKIITLQQNKINELRILKKYLLQKLFI